MVVVAIIAVCILLFLIVIGWLVPLGLWITAIAAWRKSRYFRPCGNAFASCTAQPNC